MMDLDLGIISEVEKRQKKKLLLDYLYTNLKNHNFWAYRYFFCELLGLINVTGKYNGSVRDGSTSPPIQSCTLLNSGVELEWKGS